MRPSSLTSNWKLAALQSLPSTGMLGFLHPDRQTDRRKDTATDTVSDNKGHL